MSVEQISPSPMRRVIAMVIAVFVAASGTGLIGAATRASAADTEPADDPSRGFFGKYCQTCHAGEKPKGDFAAETLSQDFAEKVNRKKWLNVVEQLKKGTMPPKGKPRPTADELKALID